MATYQLNVDTDGAHSATETISKDMFGAVQTGFHDFEGFERAVDEIGIGLIRWPGGHLSETRPEVYGLDKHGLFDATDLWTHAPNRDRPDLEESLEFAVENQMKFAFIVPTARYSDDIETGELHLSSFLEDLFIGEYGALPKELTIEIGNEYKALPEFSEDPEAYGQVASRFVEIVQNSAEMYLPPDELAELRIAVQMGVTDDDNSAILGAFSADSLSATNSLVFHSLPISMQNLNGGPSYLGNPTQFEAVSERFEDWKSAIGAAGGSEDPELFMSAWTVGGSSNSPDGIDLEWHDYGLRGATVALESISGNTSIGVDKAAIWGVDVNNLNSVTSTEFGELTLSHTGAIFQMMSEALPGSTYLGEFAPHSRNEDVMHYAFGKGDTITTYVAVNELSDANELVSINFGDGQSFQLLSTTLLSTKLDESYDGTFDDVESRLYEVPTVSEFDAKLSEDGLIVDFGMNYEVAQIVVQLQNGLDGSMGSDWIQGSDISEKIRGFADDDFVIGGGGHDTISGHRGDDTIQGGAGNDYVYGNDGDDHLSGNFGHDEVVGGPGIDSIFGGDGNDVLSGHNGGDEIWGGNGNDFLYGNSGNDTLIGGAGHDRLVGGPGDDIMTGGEGKDKFVYADNHEGGAITDFVIGEDLVDVSTLIKGAEKFNVVTSNHSTEFENIGPNIGKSFVIEIGHDNAGAFANIFSEDGSSNILVHFEGLLLEELEANFSDVFEFGNMFISKAPQPILQGSSALEETGVGNAEGTDVFAFEQAPNEIPLAVNVIDSIGSESSELFGHAMQQANEPSSAISNPQKTFEPQLNNPNGNLEEIQDCFDNNASHEIIHIQQPSQMDRILKCFRSYEDGIAGQESGDRSGWFDLDDDRDSATVFATKDVDGNSPLNSVNKSNDENWECDSDANFYASDLAAHIHAGLEELITSSALAI